MPSKGWVPSPIPPLGPAFPLLSIASSTGTLLPGLPPLRNTACPLQRSYTQVCGKLTDWDQTSFLCPAVLVSAGGKLLPSQPRPGHQLTLIITHTPTCISVSQSVSTNCSDALPPWKASIIILTPNNRLDASVHVATLLFKAVTKQSNYCSNQTLDTFHNQQ